MKAGRPRQKGAPSAPLSRYQTRGSEICLNCRGRKAAPRLLVLAVRQLMF